MAAAPLRAAVFLLVAVSHCWDVAAQRVVLPDSELESYIDKNLGGLKDFHITDERVTDADGNSVSTSKSNPEPEADDMPTENTRTVPAGCLVDPTYINEGAVEKKRTNSWQHPMIIEYECDQKAEEKYKYVAGTTEARCDAEGKWTLPAMICVPTTCYLPGAYGKAMYAGDADKDKKRHMCQKWAENSPHASSIKQFNSIFPYDESLDAVSNKCRDPNGEGKPWCYTTSWDWRWIYCDVKECKKTTRCGFPPFITGTQPVKTEVEDQKVTVIYTCHKTLSYVTGDRTATCDLSKGTWTGPDMLCASEHCFYYGVSKRAIYRGKMNVTKSGRVCQNMESQKPHHHNKRITKLFTSLAEIGSRCMDDVGGAEGIPWCYTVDKKKRWEECAIPECDLHGYN